MLLQLKPLFMGEVSSFPIDVQLDLSNVEFQGMHPFVQPVKVKGEATETAGIVTLRMAISYCFNGQCDRCAEPYLREGRLSVEHILVAALDDEENDDYVLLDNFRLLLDELVTADLILGLPSKNLCRTDCRGLCPRCGKNLNEGLCGCRSDTVDPRLEALRQLIN